MNKSVKKPGASTFKGFKKNDKTGSKVNLEGFGPFIDGIDYSEEVKKCCDFLENYSYRDYVYKDTTNNEDEHMEPQDMDDIDSNTNNNGNSGNRVKLAENIFKYRDMIKQVANRKRKQFDIELDDVFYYKRDIEFVQSIENHTLTYHRLFTYALDQLMPPPLSVQSTINNSVNNSNSEEEIYQNSDMVLDLLAAQRIERKRQLLEQNEIKADSTEFDFPKEILRRFELHLIPRINKPLIPIRLIRSEHIGRLVTLTGICTRVTDVKPLVVIALYTCDSCGAEVFQEVTSREFMPLFDCKSKQCNEAGKRAGTLTLQTRGSKFIKFQEVKIQEIANQVPIGHTPRSIKVYMRGELTRKASPGDIVTLSGIFLPTPYTGHKAIRAGLLADTFIEAQKVTQHKKTYEQLDLTEEVINKIEMESQSGSIYERLSMSLAPEIYGHLDVKKALLLMMVGGQTKRMSDGMNIRGDINICLMGDPGVAKSQLLKHIAKVAPRGIYTSGKGSSGVGLTAAVIKDSISGEFVLEGGSLVLADMGICCIDEFDKMDESDRTAIHEVMEQQTISIAKAGITTTLNARTSILAAANPALGRYNFSYTPEENFRLPHSLLSRFDLLFLMVDKADLEADRLLSEHVTFVHMHSMPPQLSFDPFDQEFIRAYVSQARKITPHVPKELTDFVVDSYITLRKQDSESKHPFTYTTARSLLGILRLAQAFARLKFSETVSKEDIEEAMRLMFMSKESIRVSKEKKAHVNPISAIYSIIKDFCKQNKVSKVNILDIQQKIVSSGFTKQQMEECFSVYKDVLYINSGSILLV
ncbi:hypothetical protein DICPUDRAFT_152234 [Dictyostelium purpureum]|uniref:DNA replication licensing factor MCM7 n=1 Tax=Dictyostelium purpureum TaxID=5786 RepID=F0ZKU0_DICPU|nr:uncharacterized protein DICPUDRAFT_152234 [Dictyostelium purpureum]EGC35437.1 hypothetical protein DICPUDRAFT_152234 [Dictyostelium purpureum]|eukprot:XP_003288050.1 hypothetical protein DICPUDRAFT_152234 [Dictyostelium purpureum]